MTLLQIMLFPLLGNPSRKQHDKTSFLPKRNLPSMFYQDQICLISCHIVEMEQVDQINFLLKIAVWTGSSQEEVSDIRPGVPCFEQQNLQGDKVHC
jgi:hypothetical protein